MAKTNAPVMPEVSQKNGCDEIAAQYKENVDAEKAPWVTNSQVKQQHSQNANCAQPVQGGNINVDPDAWHSIREVCAGFG